MSSNDTNFNNLVENTAKGVTKGALEWTKEQIINAVKKFRDKNLYFVEDTKVIEIIKEQRKKGEWDFFKNYVKDKNLRILFLMGLALRKIEDEDYKPLIDKIINVYKKRGLHFAYFVQNRIFSKYVGNILDKVKTIKEFKSEINNLHDNIDKITDFISTTDIPEQKVSEVVTKIQVYSPETFVISSLGLAIQPCDIIKEGIIQKISSNYTCEQYLAEEGNKRIYFFNRK